MASVSPLGADPADLAEVERLVRAAGTSFYRGMRILPPDRRAAMYAIYAFCRLVDDIADEPAAIEEKRRGLAAWRDRIAGLAHGVAEDATTRVLLPAMRLYGLREADFLAVIDGMEVDAETVVVAPSLAELDLYCDQVASAVGRLSVRAFGDASADADEVAWHLGRALQMVNILRDLGEDAARGRLYLPAEWLDETGVPKEPSAALRSAGLAAVCRRGSAMAHGHFAQARAAMARCDRRAMRPARLMATSYLAVLEEMDRRGWRAPGVRVGLPWWRKLWVAGFRCWGEWVLRDQCAPTCAKRSKTFFFVLGAAASTEKRRSARLSPASVEGGFAVSASRAEADRMAVRMDALLAGRFNRVSGATRVGRRHDTTKGRALPTAMGRPIPKDDFPPAGSTQQTKMGGIVRADDH